MSRRRGAFSAFEKTASQAAAATQSNQSDASREGSSLQVGAARLRRGPPKSLALHEVKTLLESLRSASTHTDFQKALVNLRGRGWGALKKREAVARLLGMAWKAPLKAAGFSIDQWGFPEMLAAVRAHQAQPGIKTLSEEIERQLRFQPGDLFGSKAGAMKQTSSAAEAAAVTEAEVQVTVTHPTDRDSVVVSVPGSASMRQVKDALARKLGRPEIARNGRMVVESPTGDLLPVPDSQRLGMKRQVFIMGTSLAAMPASGSFASQPAAKPQAPQAPQAPEPVPTRDRPLNLGEAKELLKAFREIASTKDFQKTLGNIHKQGSDAVQRMQPMFVGQSFNRTMAMYDFPLTTEGYQDMARGISKHSWNIHVKAQAHEVERLLRMPPGAFFGIPGEPGQEPDYPPLEEEPSKTPAAKVPPRQEPPPKSRSRQGIEVLARHAVDNAEVRVALAHDATFFDCKQAISKFLGRDEILRKGRLVQKKGGVYSTYKDDDPIGDIRQVLVLGADLRTVEDQEDDQPPPIHPYAAPPQTPAKSSNESSRAGAEPYSVTRRHDTLEPPPRVKESVHPSSDPSPAPPKPPEPKPAPKKVAPPPKPKPPPPPPQEYEIRIRHAVEAGPEIGLTIWTNWTFAAVREALAKKLGRDDIRRKARFVFKASAGTSPWIAFKDQETVGWAPDGSRRAELMMLGVELEDTESADGSDLPVDSVKQLLQELEKACVQEDFQAQLEKLHDRGGIALQLGITQLMGQAVQKAAESVLGRAWKLQKVIDAVKAHSNDQSVRTLADGVERRLRLDPGMLFSRPQDSRDTMKASLGRSAVEDELEHMESEPAGLPELSVHQVIAMQRELHAGFSDPAFQRRLDILENFHAKDPKLIPMRQELFLSVQSKVLPKYGFQGSLKGVFDMLEVFRRPDLQHNGEFVRLGSELNALLRLMPDGRPRPVKREAFPEPAGARAEPSHVTGRSAKPKTPTPPVERQPAPVRDIEVIIRHAVPEGLLANEEALLTVKSNATMKSVKEALVAHLGKPELLRSCRLVQPVGENGAFSSFKDTEKLNGRRALLVLGVPSLRPAGEEAPEEAPAEKASYEPRKPEGKAVAPEPPKLSIDQALALQRDLLQGFSDPDFQQKRKELVAALRHTEPRKFSVERQKLFLTVQRVVLPRYGFDGSPKGVFDMLQQFDRPEITSNGEFQQQGAVLNELLFAEDVAPGTEDVSQVSEPPEVQVRVRRAGDTITSEEVYVTVAGNATMRDVRAAVAQKCSNPAFLQRAKLVRNRGGVLVGYQDSEPIRGRRRLLFLGPSLWPDGEVGDEAPSAVEDSDSEAMVGPGGISLEKARRLLQKVKDACGSRGFQQSVAELRVRARQRGETAGTRMAVGTLFIAACQSILRKFGFGVDRQGYEQMFTAIFPHGQDPTVLALASDIEKDLGVPTGSWFGLSNDGIQDAAPRLSREEARQLVTEIRRLVGSPSFQKEVLAIRDGVRSRNGSLEELKQEVYLPFYRLVRPVALAFRLGGDPECVTRVSAALAPHLVDAKLRSAVRQVETSFLHTHQGAFFALTPQESELQGSGEASVKIRIRHAVSGAEVPLTVAASSTIGQIKEALVKAVGSEEVRRTGRLVESRRGGAFTSFRDTEKLGKRRRLLFLGADLPSSQVNGTTKVNLTRQQAVDLQTELLEGFRSDDFQGRFRELQARFPDGGATFYVERRKLVLSVQTRVIPKYGFSADLSGVFDMVRLLATFPDENNEFGRRGWEIERLIGERDESMQDKDDAGIDTEASDEVLDVQPPVPDTDAEDAEQSASGVNQFLHALDEMEDEGVTSDQAPPAPARVLEGVAENETPVSEADEEREASQEKGSRLQTEAAQSELDCRLETGAEEDAVTQSEFRRDGPCEDDTNVDNTTHMGDQTAEESQTSAHHHLGEDADEGSAGLLYETGPDHVASSSAMDIAKQRGESAGTTSARDSFQADDDTKEDVAEQRGTASLSSAEGTAPAELSTGDLTAAGYAEVAPDTAQPSPLEGPGHAEPSKSDLPAAGSAEISNVQAAEEALADDLALGRSATTETDAAAGSQSADVEEPRDNAHLSPAEGTAHDAHAEPSTGDLLAADYADTAQLSPLEGPGHAEPSKSDLPAAGSAEISNVQAEEEALADDLEEPRDTAQLSPTEGTAHDAHAEPSTGDLLAAGYADTAQLSPLEGPGHAEPSKSDLPAAGSAEISNVQAEEEEEAEEALSDDLALGRTAIAERDAAAGSQSADVEEPRDTAQLSPAEGTTLLESVPEKELQDSVDERQALGDIQSLADARSMTDAQADADVREEGHLNRSNPQTGVVHLDNAQLPETFDSGEVKEAETEPAEEQKEKVEEKVEDVAPVSEEEEEGEECEEEEGEEEDELDEDWDEAARIVDETSAQIQEVLAATRTASKKEKPALLARKRELETGAEYLDALAYLEDPVGERRRRQEADAEASRIVDEVAGKIAEVLISMRTASKKDKPGLLARKRELENLPEYLNALQYLEDPAKERQCRRQSAT